MDLLKQLYTISSKSGNEGAMKTFILKCLECVSLSIKTDRIGNLYITKGNAEKYPCVAAHLDEIHSPCKREVVIEGDKIFTVDKLWNRVGCGADDKNGLWVIINLLYSEPVLKAALFVQEERIGDIVGCRGAKAWDSRRMLIAKTFADILNRSVQPNTITLEDTELKVKGIGYNDYLN